MGLDRHRDGRGEGSDLDHPRSAADHYRVSNEKLRVLIVRDDVRAVRPLPEGP